MFSDLLALGAYPQQEWTKKKKMKNDENKLLLGA